MSERPILMSAPMVRAILDGRKSQTRRACKGLNVWEVRDCREARFINGEWHQAMVGAELPYAGLRCPYGKTGDQIWVRETGWERPERTPKMMREGADTWAKYYYDADGENGEDLKAWGFKRRPSIFMPRWASRITLEVTGVRVERLQAISEADCIAEGCEHPGIPIGPTFMPTVYRRVWETINGGGSWDANPWVWCISFRRIQPAPPARVEGEKG